MLVGSLCVFLWENQQVRAVRCEVRAQIPQTQTCGDNLLARGIKIRHFRNILAFTRASPQMHFCFLIIKTWVFFTKHGYCKASSDISPDSEGQNVEKKYANIFSRATLASFLLHITCLSADFKRTRRFHHAVTHAGRRCRRFPARSAAAAAAAAGPGS